MTSAPDPSTATVDPPPASAPRCAAESTPRARPLITTMPRAARSAPRRSATASPCGDAAREPTSATAGCSSADAAPRIQSTNGGSVIAASAAGYEGSLQGRGVLPASCPRRVAARAAVKKLRQHDGRRPAAAKAFDGIPPCPRRQKRKADEIGEVGERGHDNTRADVRGPTSCPNYTQEGRIDRVS
jgi:hypothetical protein